MTVDDVAEGVFRRLCDEQHPRGPGADLSPGQLRLALGITEAELLEAVRVIRLSDDLRIEFTTPAQRRITLAASWRDPCEDE